VKPIRTLLTALLLAPLAALQAADAPKPNVLFIICDDLNDYIGALGGHPQAKTPKHRTSTGFSPAASPSRRRIAMRPSALLLVRVFSPDSIRTPR